MPEYGPHRYPNEKRIVDRARASRTAEDGRVFCVLLSQCTHQPAYAVVRCRKEEHMAEFDVIIKNGTIIDGTGCPLPRRSRD